MRDFRCGVPIRGLVALQTTFPMADKRSRRISTFGSRFTSVISVALVLLLLGVGAMAAIAGHSLAREVRRNIGFVIKMERPEAPETTADVKAALSHSPAVASFVYLSSEDIMAQESKFLGENFAEGLETNPYSAEFDVKLQQAYTVPDSVAMLAARFEAMPAVEEVLTESAVIEGIDSTLRRIGSVILGIAVLLMVVSVALINNTVSLSIYSRRFLIHTMKLVGATRSFIRRPFIGAGALNGLFAAAIACAVVAGVRVYGATFDPAVAELLPWWVVAVLCVILVVLGVGMCALTAAIATNRYLKSGYDEMFLK